MARHVQNNSNSNEKRSLCGLPPTPNICHPLRRRLIQLSGKTSHEPRHAVPLDNPELVKLYNFGRGILARLDEFHLHRRVDRDGLSFRYCWGRGENEDSIGVVDGREDDLAVLLEADLVPEYTA